MNKASRREPSGFVRGLFFRSERKPLGGASDSAQRFKLFLLGWGFCFVFVGLAFFFFFNLKAAFPGTKKLEKGTFPTGGRGRVP